MNDAADPIQVRGRVFTLALLTALLLLGSAGPAAAIRNGQPDGELHPYVGMVFDANSVCTGAAISATVFITAAHCFPTSGQQVFVTFSPDGYFAEDPGLVTGTWYPDPLFYPACGNGLPGFDTHDLAVVILDTPAALARHVSLAPLGYVDQIGGKARIEVVGYGLQVREKDFTGVEAFTRDFAPADLSPSNGRVADEFLKVSANPGQGQGGACFGDSGGPVLIDDTIIGVNSFGTNSNCAGVGHAYRTDSQQAVDFIATILG